MRGPRGYPYRPFCGRTRCRLLALFCRANRAEQCRRSEVDRPTYAQGEFFAFWTHLCHSMSNLAALHSSVLAQRCGNVRLPA